MISQRRYIFLAALVLFVTCVGLGWLAAEVLPGSKQRLAQDISVDSSPLTTATPNPSDAVSPLSLEVPPRALIMLPVHYFQTFNNCGPATLAMVVTYQGVPRTQQQLGNELRPYQNAAGDNDDKSVTLEELAAKAEELGLVAYHRPVGDIALLEQLTSRGIPVITRTWTQVDEDIGHYRVVTGYDRTQGVIYQDDSLQGKEIAISNSDFLTMWEKFNYEYLLVIKPEDRALVETILGERVNEQVSWQRAADQARVKLTSQPDDIYARFNLSVALYHLGDYQGSVVAFEAVEDKLPKRTLWYQLEPLKAYYQLGQHQSVLVRSEEILQNGNRAYAELYHLRAQVFLAQRNKSAARQQLEQAVLYNQNYKPARELLSSID